MAVKRDWMKIKAFRTCIIAFYGIFVRIWNHYFEVFESYESMFGNLVLFFLRIVLVIIYVQPLMHKKCIELQMIHIHEKSYLFQR
jgi:hypothetical protein